MQILSCNKTLCNQNSYAEALLKNVLKTFYLVDMEMFHIIFIP